MTFPFCSAMATATSVHRLTFPLAMTRSLSSRETSMRMEFSIWLFRPTVSAGGNGEVTILRGKGNGTRHFGQKHKYVLPARAPFPIDVAAGDFNDDGRPDLATANYGTDDSVILLNLPK